MPMHLFYNTQQNTNSGGNYVRLYQYYPNENRVLARTYDTEADSYLTNGTVAYAGSLVSNGYYAEFTFPIVQRGNNMQFLRLQGLPERMQSFASGVGNWDAATDDGTNELLDAAITFDHWTNSTANPDGFWIGRFLAALTWPKPVMRSTKAE